jgi:cytochrome c
MILKKLFITSACLAFLAACGGGASTENKNDSAAAVKEEKPAEGPKDVSENPDYQKGLELIGKNDCLTCHDVAEKKIGPAYQDVANKYAGVDTAVAHLAHKVIAGGQGVWGAVPMTPHAQLAQADAEQMVKYILLLKTK